MAFETYMNKANRDARVKRLKGQGFTVKKLSSRNQCLHPMYVVDIQDGGHWDWTSGEPAKDNPAYYLRFCKSFARMGGTMRYVQCDNVAFLHNLRNRLVNEF